MRDVTGELGDVEWLSGIGRAADSAVIQKNEITGRREPIDE